MISSIHNRFLTQAISPKYQNTSANNKANEEATESTSEKIAEATKQSINTVSLQAETNKVTDATSQKKETGNIVDARA